MSKLKPTQKSEFDNIIQFIEEARTRAFSKVNAELVLLYFNVGKIVSSKVADGIWGEGTVDDLANYIAIKIPGLSGFNRRGLYRMKQFYETYLVSSDCYKLWLEVQAKRGEISNMSPVATQIETAKKTSQPFVSAVLTQIGWTNHLMILSKTKSAEEKFYYLLTSIKERYSSRELERALNTAQFERVMLSNPIVSAVRTQLPQNLFKDPYIFEFLDLPDTHSENDLEKGLILNLQKFIIEIGKGFTYIGKQFRLQVGNKDYYTDLLFYHRDLQCLVLFELKIEEFQPEFLGKLNFYLEALDHDVKRAHENQSMYLILSKGKRYRSSRIRYGTKHVTCNDCRLRNQTYS